jgi:hypothetical protein
LSTSAPPPFEPEKISASLPDPRYLYDEELAQIVVRVTAGCFAKIRSAAPYIQELHARFKRHKRGHANIAGCKTWKEFCETRLARCDRAVRFLLEEQKAESNPKRKKPTKPDLLAMLSMLMNKFMEEWPPDRPLLPVINKLREYAAQLETLERKRAVERRAEAKRILSRP